MDRLCRITREQQLAGWHGKKAEEQDVAGCEDKDSECAAWALTGECDKNAPYMKVYCPKACKLCATTN